MTRTLPALLPLLLAAGCATPDRPLASRPPAPAPTAPDTRPAVVPASFAQPAPPADPKAGPDPPPPSPAPPPVLGTPASVGGPLALGEVLTAVERHYPLLRAVEQERAIAGGRLLSALGAFDLNLTAGTDGGWGTYDNFRSTVGLSQGLPVGGVGLFAGYRTGYGDFPTYYLDRKTAGGGEFRAGISLPLLRDRAIDRPRATVQQARLDVRIAEPVIDRQRLDFTRAAARTYWNWVAAGHRLRVAAELVKLADGRDEQLKGRVEANAIPKIERTDNQQNIALRNGLRVQAERAFQQAAIELSLFLRDDNGSPTLAGLDRLPAFPDLPAVDAAGFDGLLQTAFAQRPEPQRLRLARERAGVELALATNQTLPGLNATLAAGQDVGPGKSSLSGPNGLDRTTLAAGLAFQLPVQRRDARGRITAAQALVIQLEAQLQQAEDVVRAEVQDAFSAVERAAEFHEQAAARVDLARQVAEGERAKFANGQSSILTVTLREQAAFDAELALVGAKQEFFRALADLNAAVGLPPR
jgi:outer membrane protein TolC